MKLVSLLYVLLMNSVFVLTLNFVFMVINEKKI